MEVKNSAENNNSSINNTDTNLEEENPTPNINTPSSSNENPEISKVPVTYVKHSSTHFECTINNCGKSIKTLRSLLKHAETHQDKSTYKYACEETGCGKRFLKKYSLELHYRVHMNLRPYICAICGKSFRGSGDLERHFRIHTGSKPYKCLFKNCDKSYSQPENLRIHVRTHTGDRPYCCTHPGCDKDFYSKSNLIAHLRIHQGIKPFVCEICNMAFTENSSLYKHRKIHLKKGKSQRSTSKSPSPAQESVDFPFQGSNDCIQETQFTTSHESAKELVVPVHTLSLQSSPSKTTIIFLSASDTSHVQRNVLNNSFRNTILLPSATEADISDHSCIPDELELEVNNSEDDEIVDFEDTDKDFSSDVDRSADLGLDRITHQPDASIKMGLDEFMNSIRPDNMTTEYFNGEINFI